MTLRDILLRSLKTNCGSFSALFFLFLIVGMLLLGSSTSVEAQKGIKGGSLDLNIPGANVQSVLRFLAQWSGRNIVPTNQVTGTVSLHLTNVTWRQALDAVLKQNNLVAIEEEGIINVMTEAEATANKQKLLETQKKAEELTPLKVKVIDIVYSKASDIQTSIQSMLSSRGKITVNARTNSLIITDTESSLREIGELIKGLDRETKQISIEAKLIQVNSETLDQLGVDWGVTKKENEASMTSGEIQGAVGQLVLRNRIAPGVDLSATIASLVSKTGGSIVDQPRITALDNKQSRVFSGQKIPLTRLDISGNTVVELIQVGTTLQVTPHIISEDEIALTVMVMKESVTPVAAGFQINTQTAETDLVVRDGETVVIGGLRSQDQSTEEKGIPVLKDMPLLGRFFKYTKNQVRKVELLIFMTPRIVVERKP